MKSSTKEHNNLMTISLTQSPLNLNRKIPPASILFSSIQRQIEGEQELVNLKNNKNIYDRIQEALEKKLLKNRCEKGMTAKQEFDIKQMIEICKQRRHCRHQLTLQKGNKIKSCQNTHLRKSKINSVQKNNFIQEFNMFQKKENHEKGSKVQQSQNDKKHSYRNSEIISTGVQRPKTAGLVRYHTTRLDLGEQSKQFEMMKSGMMNSEMMNSKISTMFTTKKQKLKKQSKKYAHQKVSQQTKTFKLSKQNKDPAHKIIQTTASSFSPFKKSDLRSQISTLTSNLSNLNPSLKPSSSSYRPEHPHKYTHQFNQIINNCISQQTDMQQIGRKIEYFEYFWNKVGNQKSKMYDFCKLVQRMKVDVEIQSYE